MHVHVTDCVELARELPLPPSNTQSETFLRKSGAVRSVDWVFVFGAATWPIRDIGQKALQCAYQTGRSSSPSYCLNCTI